MVLAGVSTAAAQTYVENSVKGAGTHHVIITVIPGHENEVIDTLRKHGDSIKSQHPSINGVSADINGGDVADLAKHGAATITNDHTVHLSTTSKSTAVRKKSIDPNTAQAQNVSTLRSSLGLTAGSQANLSKG